MFERFTEDARAVVAGAITHCERAGDREVGEAHLLLALLDREGSRAAFALAALGSADLGDPARRREAVARDLAEARRRGGLTRADADALSGLGIDLAEIVSRVEEAHGEGALAPEGTGVEPRGVGWEHDG
ncbi:Clp domain protein [Actinobacteria bacterium OK074]|nr:Clp domain protein [Actinobacteria bacterium OK074]